MFLGSRSFQRAGFKSSCFAVVVVLTVALETARAFAGAPLNPRQTCTVVAGVIADLSPGPLLPTSVTVETKAGWKAEFKFDMQMIETIGWMRILDENSSEVGWVPAGHEAVRCGTQD